MKYFYLLSAFILGHPKAQKINKLLFNLSLRGMGIYNYQNSLVSGERWLLKNIVRNLGDDLVVFDVGANVGNYSKDLIDCGVKVGKIFAFEPHPKTFLRLIENTGSLDQRLSPVQIALSSSPGKMTLFDRADALGSSHASLSKDIFSSVHNVEISQVEVEVSTIDLFCESNHIEKIDFLKIDVEGFELSVLQGAKCMIMMRKITTIQFEFTQLNSTLGIFFKQIYDTLSENYSIYRLLPHGTLKIDSYDPTTCEIFGYQNYVAILRS